MAGDCQRWSANRRARKQAQATAERSMMPVGFWGCPSAWRDKNLRRIHRIKAVLLDPQTATTSMSSRPGQDALASSAQPRLRSMLLTRSRLQVQANAGALAPRWGSKRSRAFLPRTGGAGWCPRPASAVRRGQAGGQVRNGCSPIVVADLVFVRGCEAGGQVAPAPDGHIALDQQARRHLVIWRPAPEWCRAARTAACSAAARPDRRSSFWWSPCSGTTPW